ncbi:MAG: hypothetical protein ACKVQR_08300 [Aquabacterium sp.]
MRLHLLLCSVAMLWTAALAAAQSPAAPAAATPATTHAADAAPQLRVLEDDNVRIEELHVRGTTERVQVRHKHQGLLSGLPRDYEIVTGSRGRDLSQPRGAVGQRVWSLFSF